MSHGSPSENSILERILKRMADSTKNLSGRAAHLGIGDDAALFRPKRGHEVILTCDRFLEGTHFLREKHPPDAVGWKCLARALSDVAAMGGVPRCFLLSLAMPESHTGRWLDAFLGGLRRASRKFDCTLAGGDTTRQRKILINVTVVGEIPNARAVLRSGARAGDIIYVTGRGGIRASHFEEQQEPGSTQQSISEKAPLPRSSTRCGSMARRKTLGDINDGPLRWTFH